MNSAQALTSQPPIITDYGTVPACDTPARYLGHTVTAQPVSTYTPTSPPPSYQEAMGQTQAVSARDTAFVNDLLKVMRVDNRQAEQLANNRANNKGCCEQLMGNGCCGDLLECCCLAVCQVALRFLLG
ncbi:hypothetical protein [Endozoicomonas sp. ONNA2]|uniref:hypothetical protein n=1 Tax=Endozoicomonas sp. ONNA2 TaxID=2828741 RepID=UPI002148CD37|nr:hypothetical protein [Endozoicomonas sp. ONNA2]